MRGDFSRIQRNTGKGYTSVLQQQGRVALDADGNEQRFIDESMGQVEAADVIGEFGGPAGNCGFGITVSDGKIMIGPGRYYVDGLVVENPEPLSYDEQRFLVTPAGVASLLGKLGSRKARLDVYLQAWQRLVTALDDPDLREPALGQADTTARLQTVWRVIARLVAVDLSKAPGPFCPLMYKSVSTRPGSPGQLTVSTSGALGDCGCDPVPAAGYRGIENQLYRVEIHRGGSAGGATFKWSRENGSVVSAVTAIRGAGDVVHVDSLGPDVNLGFSPGQWVELTDDRYQFGLTPNAPGTLYRIQRTDKENLTLTLSAPVPVNSLDVSRNARVRRWDQSGPAAGELGVAITAGTPIELENGVQVTFSPGDYQPGDYWTIPSRTASGRLDWPPGANGGYAAQPPEFVQVHEAPLASVHWAIKLPIDAPAPGEPVPAGPDPGAADPGPVHVDPVPVPVPGQPPPVIVEVPAPGGAILANPMFAPEPGIAARVVPEMAIVGGGHGLQDPGDVPGDVTRFLHGEFVAEDCRRTFSPLTVLMPPATAVHVKSINWRNDDIMTLDQLMASGLTITLDQAITGPVDGGNFIVTLEPQPGRTAAMRPSPTFRSVEILDSHISVADQAVTWVPPSDSSDAAVIEEQASIGADTGRLARVRVRIIGQVIFGVGAAGPIYLDGRAFGEPGTRQDGTTKRVDLRFPSGDGSTSSDLESWFYLAPAPVLSSVSVKYPSLTANYADIWNNDAFLGVTAPGVTGYVSQTGTVSLSRPAAATVTIALTLSSDSGGVGTVASIPAPANVTIRQGQSQGDFPVTVASGPAPGTTSTFSITATLKAATSPLGDSTQTATFTVTTAPITPI